MGNEEIIKQKPHFSPKKNISFGGKEEKEMIETFNSFDILWYAPENSEKLEEWVSFTNVNVIKISKEEQFIIFASMGYILHLIIITTGSFAEKSIPKFNGIIKSPCVLIYCMNVDYHKKWSEKYKFIDGVYCHPSQIFEHLLKFQNREFNIPIFSYKIISKKQFNFNFYNSYTNDIFFVNQNSFSLRLNKYEKFCVTTLRDLRLSSSKIGDHFYHFRRNASELINLLYGVTIDDYPEMVYYLSGLNLFDKRPEELIFFLLV